MIHHEDTKNYEGHEFLVQRMLVFFVKFFRAFVINRRVYNDLAPMIARV